MTQVTRTFVFIFILILLSAGVFSLDAQCTDPVKNIDTGECFTTIQAAIDDTDTDNGDTITVANGYYTEQVTINKSITLDGANEWGTVIRWDGAPGVVLVTADNVTIKDLGIYWTGDFSAYYHGLKIESDNCTIDNIIAADAPRDIYIYGGSYNTISNSFISTVWENHEALTILGGTQNLVCGNLIMSSADIIGYGIVLVSTTENTIHGNTVRNHDYGIYLFSAKNNYIYHNNFSGNTTMAYTFLTSPQYNSWDNGYPSGGNYWGACTDSDSDCICDSPYTIATGEVDNYPLACPPSSECE